MGKTIYEVLKERLGREPTHAELVSDVKRIKTEALVTRAEQGRLSWQRKRR